MTLETLIQETYPRFSQVNALRLEQEATLASDPFALDPGTRLSLIAEPFFILDNEIQKDNSKFSDSTLLTGMGCVGMLVLMLMAVGAFLMGSPVWGCVWLGVTAGAMWLANRQLTAATRHYMKTRIYPRLASALAPLRPSEEELAAVIEKIESRCALRTRLEDFLPVLKDTRPRPPRPAGNPPTETPRAQDGPVAVGTGAPPVINPWAK